MKKRSVDALDSVKEFREYTRQLECHLGNINNADCCCGNINKSQCFLVVEIGRKPDISVKELADILHVDKSSVSRMVEDLVQKEYVERKQALEDRRYVTLRLLAKGQQRFEKIEHDMYLKFKEIMSHIPDEKQDQVIEALAIYNKACMEMEKKYE